METPTPPLEMLRNAVAKAVEIYNGVDPTRVKSIDDLIHATEPMYQICLDMRMRLRLEQTAPARKATEKADVKPAASDKKVDAANGRTPHFIKTFVPRYSQRPMDCMVVAYANIAQTEYRTAKLTAFQHGWSSTKGLQNGFLEVMLDAAGMEYLHRPDLVRGTVQGLAENMPQGVFTVYCKGHVMPGVNGTLYNLQGCDHMPIVEVFELWPKSAATLRAKEA